MEQFVWLIVLLLIWIVPSIMRANAKKRKAAQIQAAKRSMDSSAGTTKPAFQQQRQSNTHEVEKMLEKLLGVEITQQEGRDSYEEVPVHDEKEYESVEYESLDSYFNASADSNLDLQRAEKLSFDELIAMGESDAGLMVENLDDVGKGVHPVISDFDLKKAVIYSEILTPRYF